jgi:HEAT repeat protein
MALGYFGPAARSAVPLLLVALKDPIDEVRHGAAEALKKIDPAAAAKAGLH